MSYSFDIGQVGSPKIHQLHAYWQEKRDGRAMPRRRDIDPADLKALLPDLMVGDYEPSPFRVRFRLVGTRLTEIHGLDFTGLYLDQLDFGDDDPVDWSNMNRLIFERKAPLYGKSSTPCSDGRDISFEFATFPLSDDGVTANRWVGVEDYENLDALVIERLGKARLVRASEPS